MKSITCIVINDPNHGVGSSEGQRISAWTQERPHYWFRGVRTQHCEEILHFLVLLQLLRGISIISSRL
jgi:hypothetical protein